MRTSTASIDHSVGVRCTSLPSRITLCEERSTLKVSVWTTGSALSGVPRRTAARSRAKNSSMPKGLVT
ncbi:Uncharacterised protein [Mycobacteroides abscessus subsp. abscessus]|nr:Uncharacterised protein [Mycobacteroides abscessus subsp. abscessus]